MDCMWRSKKVIYYFIFYLNITDIFNLQQAFTMCKMFFIMCYTYVMVTLKFRLRSPCWKTYVFSTSKLSQWYTDQKNVTIDHEQSLIYLRIVKQVDYANARENCLPRGITTRVGKRKNEAIFACSLFLTKLRDYSSCNFVTVVKQSRAVYHALLNVQIEQSICWTVFQWNWARFFPLKIMFNVLFQRQKKLLN